MGYRIGNGFVDSGSILQTTSENTEIIPTEPKSYPYSSLHLYKLVVINNEACHFLVNNQTLCYRNAGEGWSSDYMDAEIYSFKIIESGINYRFTGAY